MTKETDLAEYQTRLARKRTELAFERTTFSGIRTFTTLILFGIALIGFSEERMLYYYAGWGAIISGIAIFISAIERYMTHKKEIDKIKKLIKKWV